MNGVKVIQALAVIVFLAILGYVSLLLFPIAVEKMEVVDCLKYKTYSEQFDVFYLTKAEDEMCRAHGILIDAPVGNPYEKNN